MTFTKPKANPCHCYYRVNHAEHLKEGRNSTRCNFYSSAATIKSLKLNTKYKFWAETVYGTEVLMSDAKIITTSE